MNTLTNLTELNALHAVLPKLAGRDADFARDLLLQAQNAGFPGRHPLSDKQLYWVRELTKRATTPRTVINVTSFARVFEMFATAAPKMKRAPKFRLSLPDGRPVLLKLAGAGAARPGTVNISNGAPFGDPRNVWYGRVTASGTWEPSRAVDTDTMTSLTALLTALAADPGKVVGAAGLAIHSCIFCNRDLTDPRSKLVGYGEICAGHYGLPWGEGA